MAEFDLIKCILSIERNIPTEDIRAMARLADNEKTIIEESLAKDLEDIASDDKIDEEERYHMSGHAEDYYGSQLLVTDISLRMSIVALYSKLEQSRTRILSLIYPAVPSKSFSDIRKVRNTVKPDFSLNSLAEADVVNDLRFLNNDIKHNGKIGKELGGRNNWELGAPILITRAMTEQYCDSVEQNIQSLADTALNVKININQPKRTLRIVNKIRIAIYTLRTKLSRKLYRLSQLLEP